MKVSNFHIEKGHGNGLWPFFCIFALGLFVMCACTDKPHTLPLTDKDYISDSLAQQEDSTLIRPLVVDSLYHVICYSSQMDADTALMGTAIAGTTSRSRIALYTKLNKWSGFDILQPIEEHWSLVVSGRLRARKLKDLKGLTVATAREDASQVLFERMMSEAGLRSVQVFHPQINDLNIRLQMLHNNQVDAAMLPEPYATRAHQMGHRVLQTLTDTTQTVLVVRSCLKDDERIRIQKLLK